MGLFNEYQCGTCWKTFTTWKARNNNVNSTGHQWPAFECDSCSCNFVSDMTSFQHMYDMDHFEFVCCCCTASFPTKNQATRHQYETYNYCEECNRQFMNYNNSMQHLHSRVHQGQNIKCHFCKNCWTTAAGLTDHLEFSSCPSTTGANRDTLYKFVRSKDTGGVLTKKLIGYHGSSKYEANDQSCNLYRGGYECYLCHRLFSKEFKSLAAIINHLESESCGFTRFERVQRGIQDVVSGDKLIKF